MKTSILKKVTVVAERLLKERLIDILDAEGATGHTLLAVEGAGSRGVHAADFEGRNIQVETIVEPEVASRLLERIAEAFLEDFAVIAYVSDVEVLRRGKFAGEAPDDQGKIPPDNPPSS